MKRVIEIDVKYPKDIAGVTSLKASVALVTESLTVDEIENVVDELTEELVKAIRQPRYTRRSRLQDIKIK